MMRSLLLFVVYEASGWTLPCLIRRETKTSKFAASSLNALKKEKFREVSQALGFWDEARLEVCGGDGGDGCLAFRREKCVPLGGPSGGNGGSGGSVILVCDARLNTLGVARRRTKYAAPSGKRGQGASKHAKRANDMYIRVPPGTIIREWDPPHRVAGELTEDGETMIVARGGRGGRGNAAFKTDRLTAPRIAEHGENGARRVIKLELALVADVGIVGKPNAGKSTLLASCTRAKPKIADYPFTTLIPNLGVWEPPRKFTQLSNQESSFTPRARRSRVGGLGKRQRAKLQKSSDNKSTKKKRQYLDTPEFYSQSTQTHNANGAPIDAFAEQQLALALGLDTAKEMRSSFIDTNSQSNTDQEEGLVLADVPGLIEDAHLGAGMGDAFLRHVERCRVLLHLIDATAQDPIADLKAIEKELEAYSPTLAKKQRIICLNKADALQPASANILRQQFAHQNNNVLPPIISAATGENVQALMLRLRQIVIADKQKNTKADIKTKLHQIQVDFDPPFINSRDNPDRSWTLEDGRDTGYDGQWRIESARLEKIATMTNFEQPDAVARFGRVLQALGIAQDLQERGAKAGDLVMIGDDIDLEYDPIGWSPFEQLERNVMAQSDNDFEDDFELDDGGELLPFFDDDIHDSHYSSTSFLISDDDDR